MPIPRRRALSKAVRIGLAGFTVTGALLAISGTPVTAGLAQAAEAGPGHQASQPVVHPSPAFRLGTAAAAATPVHRAQDERSRQTTSRQAVRAADGRPARLSQALDRRQTRKAGSGHNTARRAKAAPATAALSMTPGRSASRILTVRPVSLSRAMGGTVSLARYKELVPSFNRALVATHTTTPRRFAMFCSQIGHESVGLKYMEEIASGAAYNGRADLGNIRPGDGVRFKGRGPIQITGRANYRTVSKWAHRNGIVPTGDYFIDHPAQMASDRHGFEGAVWYWTRARNMTAYADHADIRGATRAVNGGYNGLGDRIARWHRCLKVGLGLR